jgi:hypothetical protein
MDPPGVTMEDGGLQSNSTVTNNEDGEDGESTTDSDYNCEHNRELRFSAPFAFAEPSHTNNHPRLLMLTKYSNSSFGYLEASWRRLKVLRADAVNVEAINFYPEAVRHSLALRQQNEVQWHPQTMRKLEAGPGLTLGVVYDWYLLSMKDTGMGNY